MFVVTLRLMILPSNGAQQYYTQGNLLVPLESLMMSMVQTYGRVCKSV